jgi:hypothetical protein
VSLIQCCSRDWLTPWFDSPEFVLWIADRTRGGCVASALFD